MSKIGKKPIEIPENVEVKIKEQKALIKGPKGELSFEVRPEIKIQLKDKKLLVLVKRQTKNSKAFWGLTRAILANMVNGVVSGYEKKLEIHGLGYKAKMEEEELVLSAGFTHLVKIKSPEGIKITVEKNIITVSGIDKDLVGLIAAKIKKVRPAEPYKGKGLRYYGETIRRKAGKKVATAGPG
ncbi:MAG: 50S ribosomal protein L6 [Patescibacteria group bacterium]|nr:50S ribosomal protein L6 [Patescibacteria group bacterium]